MRRHCDRLISIGNGIMAFAVWTVVKMFGLYLYNSKEVFDYVASQGELDVSPAEKTMYTNAAIVILAIFLIIVVLIQLYTGACAIAVGRGRSKKKRRMYLVFGVIMMFFSAISVFSMTKSLVTGHTYDAPQMFQGSIIVEFTWLVLIFEMIYSSAKVNKLLSMGKHSKSR